jgi:N-acetylglucosamine kinase-like BadF-type ATPase
MLFLGVDGGGTKTAAVLVDSAGQILGWGTAGGSNYHLVGIEAAYACVKQAVDSTLQGGTPDVACFGMAGADMPHDFDQLNARLRQLGLECPFTVRNDVISILRAGSRFPYGASVVCGTGFNAGGIGKSGEEFRFPALGDIAGDRAGARRLAVRAVGEAFRAWDGRGEPTLLADAILEALHVPDLETVARYWVEHKITYDVIKNLAPLVFEVSAAGDPIAQQLVHEHGVELGISANAVLRRLDLVEEDCDVVLGGSVFYGKGDLLLNTVNEVIHHAAPGVTVKRLEVPPVVGAVMLAADAVGAELDRRFVAALPEEIRGSYML